MVHPPGCLQARVDGRADQAGAAGSCPLAIRVPGRLNVPEHQRLHRLPPADVRLPRGPGLSAHVPVEALRLAAADPTDILLLGGQGSGAADLHGRRLHSSHHLDREHRHLVVGRGGARGRDHHRGEEPRLAGLGAPHRLPGPVRALVPVPGSHHLHLLHGGLRALRRARPRAGAGHGIRAAATAARLGKRRCTDGGPPQTADRPRYPAVARHGRQIPRFRPAVRTHGRVDAADGGDRPRHLPHQPGPDRYRRRPRARHPLQRPADRCGPGTGL